MTGTEKASRMSLRQLIWACVGMITLVFVVAMSIFLSARFAVADSVHELSAKTLTAQDNVTALGRAYVDQETGQRGFLLTANPTLLEPYNQGRAEVDRLVAALRNDLAGDVEGSGLLSAVVSAATAWQTEAAEPQIAARRAGTIAPAQLDVMTQSGKRLFDELRTQLSALQARASQMIDAQLKSVNHAQ